MNKFFSNSIESKFIKSLLYNTYLPLCNTVDDGDYVIKDFTYIYKSHIVKCVKSGYCGEGAELDYVSNYTFGEAYPKYTERYVSKYDYYDTETHEKLGAYIRCYRDIYGIDLTPFYNCFSGSYFSNYIIKDTSLYYSYNNQYYKLIKVPIKFNKKYTIAIDCSSEVKIAPAFIQEDSLVHINIDGVDTDLTSELCSVSGNVATYMSLSFKKPITHIVYNTNPSNCKKFQQNENNLCLLIQVPIENDSSIVVLEGSHFNTSCKKVFNVEYIDSISTKEQNYLMESKLKLLQFNTKNNYPFSDRLIEYLLMNVISSRDTIDDNISRVQNKVKVSGQSGFYKGAWTPYLRKKLFDYYMDGKNNCKLDINGFVDKDIESYLRKSGD